MGLDKSGLEERTFEVPSMTNKRTYTFLCNMETNVSRWSKNAIEYFGLPNEYMYNAGEIWQKHIHPDDLDEYLDAYEKLWSGESDIQDFEYRAKNKAGEYVLCTCRCIVMHSSDEEPDLFTGTIINHGIEDVIDAVTNLHSSQEFMSCLRQIIENNATAAVMEVAVNKFNHINVMYGYNHGNEVLRKLSEELKQMVRGCGRAYRLDGAKFAIIIDGKQNQEKVKEIYEELQEKASKQIKVHDLTVPISLCGSALLLENYEGTDISVKSSLAYALEQSKHEHHGELVFFQGNEGRDTNNLKLISEIHRCILENFRGFYLCYQPLVDVGTDTIIGAEALLRWRQEPYGDVPPGMFIPWLEMDPAFYDLGNWIINQALTDMVEIKKTHPHFILNVNIAASQLERKEFRQAVIAAVEKSGFPPEDFFMELTERCRDLDYEFLQSEMAFFHSHGIQLSLDDFGTGSSSLALLRELPIDELKIDMSFIRNIKSSFADQSIVKNIVQCANDMGLKTCLEGVENEDLSKYLRQYRATYYQGYHYSRPVQKEEFFKLMSV